MNERRKLKPVNELPRLARPARALGWRCGNRWGIRWAVVIVIVSGSQIAAAQDPVPSGATEPVVPSASFARPSAAEATSEDFETTQRWGRRDTLLASLTIFALAVFLGFELITKVPPTLHTPLMSGSNAISGITLVGAILVVGMTSSGWLIPLLGTVAVITATVNAVGGFAVTHRMLAMFKRK